MKPLVLRAVFQIVAVMLLAAGALAQTETILLWPEGAPGPEGKSGDEVTRLTEQGEHVVSNLHRPAVLVYLPAKNQATGAAVVVLPGGGHKELWMDHEGSSVGQWLSARGVAAIIVKYRLARQEGSSYTVEGTELGDVKRAIRLVRSRAKQWNIDPERVGVMGFSAGGELAALAGSRYDAGTAGAADPIERESSRPAFQALIYPAPGYKQTIAKGAPPAFLACGENDLPEIAQGLAELYLAFKRAGVSAELHIFARTGHGFGLRASNPPPVSAWPQMFLDWMGATEFLPAASPAN
jgi:endo-1,4-beta-xylanase